ncbi:hypothetical protein NRB16_19805 [Pseudomonas sp. LJDD11]|uniref:hypothetical protein n=1 Tax=Pseudomonas sp. LJDD11 TaxID=2931984 RepID=UPI00211C0564|nr:hypothetical protein [Pseudomonas sp. LJDD11]MCQ9425762.1 hypothetical protein [Pseudomonas sp. LJDD11]
MREYKVRFYCVIGILGSGAMTLLIAPEMYSGLIEGRFTAHVGTRQNPLKEVLVFNDDPLTFLLYFIKDFWFFLIMAGMTVGLLWRLIRGPRAFDS